MPAMVRRGIDETGGSWFAREARRHDWLAGGTVALACLVVTALAGLLGLMLLTACILAGAGVLRYTQQPGRDWRRGLVYGLAAAPLWGSLASVLLVLRALS